MNAFITAQGFAKTGMLSVLIGAVSNIILDPIFIFGLGMNVRGAALATIISQALSCLWVVSFSLRKADLSADPKEESAAGSQGDRPLRGPGGGYLYHAGQRECDLRLL